MSEGWSNTVEQAKALNKKTIISILEYIENKEILIQFFNPFDHKKLKKILDESYKNLKKLNFLKA